MNILASQIRRRLEAGEWEHCAIYENELQRLWPLNEKNRKAKIAQFAKEHGFRLSVYKPGLCAIFEREMYLAAPVSDLVSDRRFVMLAKRSLSQLRLVLLRVASQTRIVLSHYYTSLESFLKAKWQRIHPPKTPTISTHVYEIRLRPDKRGVDLISDTLPFSPLWYVGPNAVSNAIGYAKHRSRSHDAVILVYDDAGNVIDTHEQAGEFKEW